MSERRPVELYHFWSSVCSVKVRMCLEEKGVPWTSRYVDLFRLDQMQPEYLKLNPDGCRADPCPWRMEKILVANGDWIVGEFSLADIAVAPYLFRLSALGEERFWSEAKRPHVADWYKRILGRRSFQVAASWPDETGGGCEEVRLKASLPTSGSAPAQATGQEAPRV